MGYRIAIYYFTLANATLAVGRIRLRVAMGVHDVPEDTIHRRFSRSLYNFNFLHMPLADQLTVFDNTVLKQATLVATQKGGNLKINEPELRLKL